MENVLAVIVVVGFVAFVVDYKRKQEGKPGLIELIKKGR